MASLLDYYFSDPNAGQNRRSALDGLLGSIGDSADYYLGPTGVPDRARSALGFANEISPVTGTLRSMDAAGRGNYGEAALEGVGVLAPAGIARMAGPIGQNAGRVVSEMMTGFDSIGQAAAKSYMLGDRLAPSSGYTGAGGKPSTVGLPDGQRYDAKPINAIEQSARDYMQSRGMDTRAFDEYPQYSEDRGRLIAAAYDMMPHDPSNPLVARSYDAMIQETIDQYNSLKNSGVEFKFLKEGMDDPYAASPALGYQDLVENGQLYVYPTDFGYGSGNEVFDPSTNPLLKSVGRIGDKDNAVANDAFRAVHDAYGHFGGGNPFFRRQGEERAFLEHSRMYSPEARGAMVSETRGQNSWVNQGPQGLANRSASGADTVFAEQKAGLMAPWTSEAYGMPSAEQRGILEGYIRANKWQE